MFNPQYYTGGIGKYDGANLDKKGRNADEKILHRFYKKFPALKITPEIFNFSISKNNLSMRPTFAIQDYIDKYKRLMKQGYSDQKAFAIVEEEMTQMFEKQMDETRIIRGVALHKHGNSYLDRAQQVAEWESLAKMNRFVRD